MFDNNFRQLKVIPPYLVRWYLGKTFKFYSNLEISRSILHNFPKFYQEVSFRWGKYLFSPTTLPSTVPCQFTLFNKLITLKTDNKSIFFHILSNSNLNFWFQLVHKIIRMSKKTSFNLKIKSSFNAGKLSMLFYNFGKILWKTFPGI